ncbi:glycosyltransferase family 2 protein [Flavihumibacter stibioxidans]|uniref:Glycosyltransferase 2-like domain-containing protein n=1 Tax=Flavihumibacter stibioxidans TaxID=1834163 RepID=A0ABR7MB51_9BACT|nr:glycosyltransferase family 2 protein [Flavihumibacter stibioxidans]MBC6492260.1 hypothetical protein [Flavihumibacter stibioxidans]
MQEISVVIVAKDEADIIGQTISSLSGLTDDIFIADTGSKDDTIAIARSLGARVETLAWEGFGRTKNKALAHAKYEWVLFLDADESIDETLKQSLLNLSPEDPRAAFKIRFKNYIGNKRMAYGEWGRECKLKVFNRKYAQWDNAEIHEKILVAEGGKVKTLDGFIIHSLMKDLSEYAVKMNRYGELMARKYLQNGKKAGWFKLYFYPFFRFLQIYLFRLGLLDGRLGFAAAFFSAYYAFLKYHRLRELQLSGAS